MKLIEHVLRVITTGQRFVGYDTTQDIFKFWWALYTGFDQDKIVLSDNNETKQHRRTSETKNQKKQAKRIYNASSPKLMHKAIATYEQTFRAGNAVNSIKVTNEQKKEIEKILFGNSDTFFGDQSAREYLDEVSHLLNCIDPNAFMIVNFILDKNSRAKGYPMVVASKNIWDRKYTHGSLDYLVFEKIKTCLCIDDDGKESMKQVIHFWGFNKEEAVRIIKFPSDVAVSEIPKGAEKIAFDDKDFQLWAEEFPISNDFDVAKCVGFVKANLPGNDPHIFESMLLPAKSVFKDVVWSKRTLDLHMMLHGIAQKFVLVPYCSYNDKQKQKSCNGTGFLNGNLQDKCPVCKGSGMQPYHKNEQDIITIPVKSLDKDTTDLTKVIHYQPIPIDVIKLNKEELERAEIEVLRAIVNTSIFESSQLYQAKTATEVKSQYTPLNNVLYKFGKQDAALYRFIIKALAGYLDLKKEDIEMNFSYSNDFQLEDTSDLLSYIEKSQHIAPPEVIDKQKLKLMKKVCVESPEDVLRFKARNRYKVARHRSDQERLLVVNMIPNGSPLKIRFIYFDEIFSDLEKMTFKIKSTPEEKDVKFHELPIEEADAAVDEITKEYQERHEKLIADGKQAQRPNLDVIQ